MEKDEFEPILRSHLDPIYKAISKLEEAQERIIIISRSRPGKMRP